MEPDIRSEPTSWMSQRTLTPDPSPAYQLSQSSPTSTMAGGLIPLMLKAGAPGSSRMSVSFQPSHSRQSSTGSTSSLRARTSKRYSQQPLTLTLPAVPYTQAEWRRAIAEVKAQHAGNRYRACSARCAEILDNIKDRSQVEPVYLIYLHFYAAASMEMCTRPLPLNSPYRTTLLQQARSHYDQAAALIQAAEDSVDAKTRSSSAASTNSWHSPAGSVSSHTWTADTGMTSPTNSICSFDDLTTKKSPRQPSTPTPPLKRVKKVSFSLPKRIDSLPTPPPLVAIFPAIRPDSPTLGFDDEYFHAGAALQVLPEIPKQPPPPMHAPEVEYPLVPEDEHRHHDAALPPPPPVERAVHRYASHLSSLSAQLARHAANLDGLLARPSSSAAGRAAAVSEMLLAERRRSVAAAEPGEMRSLDRLARVERLREGGWRRKRFDPTRYEELREAVLAELGE